MVSVDAVDCVCDTNGAGDMYCVDWVLIGLPALVAPTAAWCRRHWWCPLVLCGVVARAVVAAAEAMPAAGVASLTVAGGGGRLVLVLVL